MDTMTWSFSRLNSYYNCAYEWYLHYLECSKSENGFFGEYGSLIHKILEKYIKGELSLFDLNQYYEENFNESVPHDAPPNKYVDIRQSYYDKGIEYLNNIDLVYSLRIYDKKVTLNGITKDEIAEVLLTLTEREEKVIRLRFGLDDGKSKTLEEVGQIFGVTRERIRQIEAKALRKLRHPSRSRKLKDYMGD